MTDLTLSDLLDSSAFIVADEDRWPGLLAAVTGAYITVYTWDPRTSKLGDSVDVYDPGRFDGFYAATAAGEQEQRDETVLERLARVAAVLDGLMEEEE
jgi:hypothetical protein